jgi:hypothetical protein
MVVVGFSFISITENPGVASDGRSAGWMSKAQHRSLVSPFINR